MVWPFRSRPKPARRAKLSPSPGDLKQPFPVTVLWKGTERAFVIKQVFYYGTRDNAITSVDGEYLSARGELFRLADGRELSLAQLDAYLIEQDLYKIPVTQQQAG